MSALDIPTDIEVSEISSNLNSSLLFVFLMGMYTAIYFGTIYVYFAKNPSKYHLVPAAITILYLSGIVQTAVQWYSTKWQFIDNGDTRQSVFLAQLGGPPWVFVTLNTSNCISFAIADGLLIWRCFHVWNRSWRVVALSVFLIFTEIALFLVQISFNAKYTNLTISRALAAELNAIMATALFMSFTTTLITTVLIAFRINSVSKQQGASSRRFKHIVDIVVQSGAVYALSQLVAAIAGVIPGLNIFHTRQVALGFYAPMLNFSTAGISSTIMVARVAMLSSDTTYPSTSVHLSGLQFQARSTHPTVNMEAMEITHSVDVDTTPESKVQAVEEKV